MEVGKWQRNALDKFSYQGSPMLEVTHWTLFLHIFRFKLYSVLIFDACMFFCVTNLHISKIFHKCSSILCNLGKYQFSYDKILNSRFELSLLQQIAQSVFSIRCCYYCYRKKSGSGPWKKWFNWSNVCSGLVCATVKWVYGARMCPSDVV